MASESDRQEIAADLTVAVGPENVTHVMVSPHLVAVVFGGPFTATQHQRLLDVAVRNGIAVA